MPTIIGQVGKDGETETINVSTGVSYSFNNGWTIPLTFRKTTNNYDHGYGCYVYCEVFADNVFLGMAYYEISCHKTGSEYIIQSITMDPNSNKKGYVYLLTVNKDYTVNIVVPTTFLNESTNSRNFTYRIRLVYAGTGFISYPNGEDASIIEGELYVSDTVLKPSFNIAVSEKATLPSGWSYTQNISDLAISLSGVSYKYGASFKGCRITLGGYSGNLTSRTGSFRTGKVNLSGSQTITAVLTDSRNVSTTVTKAITIKPYSVPKATNLEITRCNSDGTVNDEGTCAKFVNPSFTVDTNQTNSLSLVEVKYSTAGGTVTTKNITSNPKAVFATGLNSDLTYDVSVKVADKVSNATYTSSIGSSYFTMDFLTGGKGIAFGKASTKAGFECNMDANFLKSLKLKDKVLDKYYDGIATYRDGATSGGFVVVRLNVDHTWMGSFEVTIYGDYTYQKWAINGYNYNHESYPGWYAGKAELIDGSEEGQYTAYLGYSERNKLWVAFPSRNNFFGATISNVNHGYTGVNANIPTSELFTIERNTASDISALGTVDRAITEYATTHHMGAKSENGYWGMTLPSGNIEDYIRTTKAGLIPYVSGGSGTLGTVRWPFDTAYVNNIYGTRLYKQGVLIGETNLLWSGSVFKGGSCTVSSSTKYELFGCKCSQSSTSSIDGIMLIGMTTTFGGTNERQCHFVGSHDSGSKSFTMRASFICSSDTWRLQAASSHLIDGSDGKAIYVREIYGIL